MSRTPLMSALRRAVRLAVQSKRLQIPADELAGLQSEARLSRRALLRTGGAMATALMLGSGMSCSSVSVEDESLGTDDSLPKESGGRPGADTRIVIVGAGLAGLAAAYHLKKKGVVAVVYEGSKRIGGRVHTAHDIMYDGLTTELGGEFIDTDHEEMFRLADELGLELLDTADELEAGLKTSWFFEGRSYSEEEIVEAFIPLAERMAADLEPLGEVVNYLNEGGAGKLDRMSIAEYLDNIGASGWVRKLLDVAFVTEFGLETGDQSALNMLFMISTEIEGGFEVYGASDERFKIKGGNQRIARALGNKLRDQVMTGCNLEAIEERANGTLVLTFEQEGGFPLSVDADMVLVTIPFTKLREVDLLVELPAVKKRSIQSLGYGTNAKVMLGVSARPWRKKGLSGEAFTDEEFQLVWDNARCQGTGAGGLTVYLGGKAGRAANKTPKEQLASRYLAGIEKVFPGTSGVANGRVETFHWPSYPFTLGSYAAYRPGQWTSIAGAEMEEVGNLYFAGEHCSLDYQGFMNGAAETGRLAAEKLLARMEQAVE